MFGRILRWFGIGRETSRHRFPRTFDEQPEITIAHVHVTRPADERHVRPDGLAGLIPTEDNPDEPEERHPAPLASFDPVTREADRLANERNAPEFPSETARTRPWPPDPDTESEPGPRPFSLRPATPEPEPEPELEPDPEPAGMTGPPCTCEVPTPAEQVSALCRACGGDIPDRTNNGIKVRQIGFTPHRMPWDRAPAFLDPAPLPAPQTTDDRVREWIRGEAEPWANAPGQDLGKIKRRRCAIALGIDAARIKAAKTTGQHFRARVWYQDNDGSWKDTVVNYHPKAINGTHPEH